MRQNFYKRSFIIFYLKDYFLFIYFVVNFRMNMFMGKGLKCVILTSGTLAPLKPLISELAISVPVFLENPHIVKNNQICVKIVSTGPDQEVLVCNYQNR